MNSEEITSALKSTKHLAKQFAGVFARDQLVYVNINRLPISIVINTDTSDGPGEHWVAMYINSNNEGEYFDSYGLPILPEVCNLMNNSRIISLCTHPIQAPGSVVCGQYCIFYLSLRSTGIARKHVLALLTRYEAFVTDNFVNEYVRACFGIHKRPYSVKIFSQICKAYDPHQPC